MCRISGVLAMAVALSIGLAAGAESVIQGGSKPKTDEKAAGSRADTQTKTGTIAAKPDNAPDGVLAVLKVQSTGTTGKKTRARKGAGEEEETYNLMASGATEAVQIKEFAAREAYAEVTGTIAENTIRVTSLKAVPKPSEPEKRKGAKKKAEQ